MNGPFGSCETRDTLCRSWLCDSGVLNTLCWQVCLGFPGFLLSWIPVLAKLLAVTGPLESRMKTRHWQEANGQDVHWPLVWVLVVCPYVALLELATCPGCNLPSLLDSWDRLQQPCNPECRSNWTENGWAFKCDAPMQGGLSTKNTTNVAQIRRQCLNLYLW